MKKEYVKPLTLTADLTLQPLADVWSLPTEGKDDIIGGGRYHNHLWDDDDDDDLL